MFTFNKETLLTPVMIQTIDTMVRRFVSEPFINTEVSIELLEWDIVFGTFVDEDHTLNPWQSRTTGWTTDPQYYEAYARDFSQYMEDYELEEMRPQETFAVRVISSRRYPTWAVHEKAVSHKRNLEVNYIPFSVERVNQIKSREKRLIELGAPAIILQNEARRKSFAEYMAMTLSARHAQYTAEDFRTKPSRNYLRYRCAPMTINNHEQFRKCYNNQVGA